ncbi:hypothetical protein GALL_519510 [mine drainage metagenome]|uniref:Uncharacterized protein n=1 Tax=mine drainage metagenome TaxID=410659 RepID=A0A1J5PF79_9ZZZZ
MPSMRKSVMTARGRTVARLPSASAPLAAVMGA